ncbi:MAG: twin-arginine translocase subunit TatC [Neomegalonema sp.]|nr:twin-arginine translocase subunit TatC [Neomegalonema sp.]
MSKTSTDEHVEASTAPLIEHLAELRDRMIRVMIAIGVCIIICFIFAKDIYDLLSAPLCTELTARGEECELIFTALHEKFFTDLKLSMFGGLFLAFPLIANQLWRFVAPGLYRDEQSAFLPFLLATPILFAMGASLVYFFVMPMAFGFFLDYGMSKDAPEPPPPAVAQAIETSLSAMNAGESELDRVLAAASAARVAVDARVEAAIAEEASAALNEPDPAPLSDIAVRAMKAGIAARAGLEKSLAAAEQARTYFLGKVNEYLSLVMTFIFAFGLSFQLPVVLTLLGRAGIVSADDLSVGRKYAVVGIAAFAAVLTPPDPFSQLGLGIPIYLLYEISILLVRAVERRREEREAAELMD